MLYKSSSKSHTGQTDFNSSLWKRAVALDQSRRARAYGTVVGRRGKTNMAEFSAECTCDSKVLTEQNSNKVEIFPIPLCFTI